jgi:hypothetical protein
MYKIVRTNDGKSWEVESYKFLVFENGLGKELINNPVIGSALMLPPYTPSYTWLTSPITEIENEFSFKTNNSNYLIEK